MEQSHRAVRMILRVCNGSSSSHRAGNFRAAFIGAGATNLGPDDPPPSFPKAGWLDPRAPVEFGKYTGYIAAKLGGLIDYYSPINEPNVVAVET